MRKYKSGTTWCVWRWTSTPSGYITRLHIVKTPWFTVMLHWINGPDPEPHTHDHPVSFLSFILRGGYSEHRQDIDKSNRCPRGRPHNRTHTWFNHISAGRTAHRIYAVTPGTLTLVLAGPKTREWGFHTPDGWVHWKDYNDAEYEKDRDTQER